MALRDVFTNTFNKIKAFVKSDKTSFDKEKTPYRMFRDSGLGVFDSFYSSLYYKAVSSDKPHAKLLERLARPLAFLSPSAKGNEKTEKIGLFSDSSLMIVSRFLSFMKKHVFESVACLLGAVLVAMVIHTNSMIPTVEVYVNGIYAGSADSIKTVDAAQDRAEQRITDITGKCYDLPCTISYKVKSSNNSRLLSEDDFYEIFNEYTAGETRNAYGLFIDGKEVAVVMNRQDISFAFSKIEAQHLALTGEAVHIANRVDIRYGEYAKDKIISRTELTTLLSTDTSNNLTETRGTLLAASSPEQTETLVAAGESATDISANITESLSQASDPSVVISYETITYETVREYVDYQTRYLEDTSLFKGQTRVSTYGHRGRADVTYAVSTIDGEEVGRTVFSTSVVYEPVTEVIRIGTRDLPEKLSDEVNGGKFMILPVINPRITDRFGTRDLYGKSDFHYGLDLAANYGTSIYAAASGKVIYAEYHSSFGNCIKILHENGVISLYAHCSDLLFEVGDVVNQGDIIAKVGNTGYSYGNHCHFEVIIDDERVDPELYIYTED